jgi:peptide deformylase
MAVQSITRLGTEKLIEPSEPLKEFGTPFLYNLLQDMQDTMKELNGVGIAAPQIGVNLQVVIFGFEHSKRYPDAEAVPFTVLINPTLEPLSDEMVEDWEGCLSIPGMRGLVPRYKKIKYSGYDAEGNFFSRKVKDFHARVVQHELDHINGSLYIHRINDLKQFGYDDLMLERIAKWHKEKGI